MTRSSAKHSFVGPLLRVTVGKLIAASFRARILNPERVPEGGLVLAGNHVSYGDPVILWCVAPRPVHFMAKAELWSNPVFAWFLDRVWAFPVRRGKADRDALTAASDLLRSGEVVGIFPQGTRISEGESSEAHGGAAFLAMRNGVPIVPVGIAGTERIRPKGKRLLRFPRLVVSVGEPISPASFSVGGRKERADAMTAAVMRGITEQLSEARKVAER